MNNKPVVFLSHSSKDKGIIEKIASDLRRYRIESWYDDWEIQPGESLRKKIFIDGIPNCDLFFVYLTQNSIDSAWVQRELDAFFIQESRSNKINIITFVDKLETIDKVPSDIAGLNLPIINEEQYNAGFLKLVSSVYQKKIDSIFTQKNLAHENQMLKLENQISELKNHIRNLNEGNKSFERLFEQLNNETIEVMESQVSIIDCLMETKHLLAVGETTTRIGADIFFYVDPFFQVSDKYHQFNETASRFLSPLIINSIVDVQKPTDEKDGSFFLSDYGKKFVTFIVDNQRYVADE